MIKNFLENKKAMLFDLDVKSKPKLTSISNFWELTAMNARTISRERSRE